MSAAQQEISPETTAALQAQADARITEENAGQEEAGTPEPWNYRTYTAAEILALPDLSWRVKGLLPAVGLAALYGPSRVGKSFLALDMALAVAKGEEWFSWKTHVCGVLYVFLEGAGGLKNRLKAWVQEKGNALPQNLTFIKDPFNLRDASQVNAVIAAAPRGGLVIIDTLNRATPSMDENSSRDMSDVIAAASKIQEAMQGLVLLVTHSGKEQKNGIRGHSSLFAAMDAVLEASGTGDVRALRTEKLKDGDGNQAHNFALTPVFLGNDADGDAVTSCVVTPCEGEARQESAGKPLSPALQYGLNSFRAACEQDGGKSVHVEAWRLVYYAGHTGDTTEAKRKAYERARKELVTRGILAVVDDVYSETGGDNSGPSLDFNPDTGQGQDKTRTSPGSHLGR
jgi:hypothetical protein